MKAIFITGGASGIGRAVAQRFAAEGWRIGIADVDTRGLAETVAMLPDGADSYDMDVRDREAWGRSLDDFTRQTGQLDVLCNNRSEEHTSELQSLMRISYAVFCLKKKTTQELTHLTNKHYKYNIQQYVK